MITIDHNAELKDAKGVYLTEDNDRIIVADIIVNSLGAERKGNAKDARMAFSVMMKLADKDFKGELEDAEYDLCLKSIEENSGGYPNLVRGQVLRVLDKAKE